MPLLHSRATDKIDILGGQSHIKNRYLYSDRFVTIAVVSALYHQKYDNVKLKKEDRLGY